MRGSTLPRAVLLDTCALIVVFRQNGDPLAHVAEAGCERDPARKHRRPTRVALADLRVGIGCWARPRGLVERL